MITHFNQLDLNQTYSYADYLTWRLQERIELIKGKIYKMSPAPSPVHQSIVTGAVSILYGRLKNSPCQVFPAPFDVRLPDHLNDADDQTFTVVQPDVCVVCDDAKIDEKGCLGPPDLIVEIVSSGSVQKDLHEKYELYESAAVTYYWIIQPNDKTLIQYKPVEKNRKYQPSKLLTSGDVLQCELLAGGALNLEEIFGDLLKEPEEGYGGNYKRL